MSHAARSRYASSRTAAGQQDVVDRTRVAENGHPAPRAQGAPGCLFDVDDRICGHHFSRPFELNVGTVGQQDKRRRAHIQAPFHCGVPGKHCPCPAGPDRKRGHRPPHRVQVPFPVRFLAHALPVARHVRKPERVARVAFREWIHQVHGKAAEEAAALQFKPGGIQDQGAQGFRVPVTPQRRNEASAPGRRTARGLRRRRPRHQGQAAAFAAGTGAKDIHCPLAAAFPDGGMFGGHGRGPGGAGGRGAPP